jgi:inorganic pyrophosphatase
MDDTRRDPIGSLMTLMFRAHPWHGVPIGHRAPDSVTAYIEMVPTDTVKYELDKKTGLLKLDRPQLFSSLSPAPYGLIPQTYCGDRVGRLCAERAGRSMVRGDGDPLDVLVLTEKTIAHGDLLVQVRPIGGLRMIDGDEADDKIVAVLLGDAVFDERQDIDECSPALIDRLQHYFLTYKEIPNRESAQVELVGIYGRDEAHDVIRASQADYDERFQGIERLLG